MGNRGNILLTGFSGSEDARIYLYTHWGGSGIYDTLAQSLDSQRARNRRGDDSYLARIIVDDFFRDIQGDETGGGIAPYVVDNEHVIPVVNLTKGTVTLSADGLNEDADSVSFDAFIELVKAARTAGNDLEAELIRTFGGLWPYTDETEEE